MTPDLPQVESAIVEMTNQFRREQELNALRRDGTLDRAAKKYARYLARSGKFSHTADGQQPAERAKAAGYDFCQVAENLALHRDSRGFKARDLAAKAIKGWKESRGHRRNMLAPHVTEIGVGLAKSPDINQYVSVQLFGRPKELRYEFSVRNTTRTQISYTLQDTTHELPPTSEITHTVCLPGQLSFAETASDGTEIVGNGSSFQTRSGLRLRARRAPSGRIVVEEKPSAQ